MLVNLTEILLSEDKTEEIQIDLELQEFTCILGSFPVISRRPARFTFTNMGKGKALVEGEAALVLRMNCDRCLKEVDQPVDAVFSLEVTEPDWQQEGADSGQNFMEGYQLNITDLVSSELLTNWPTKVNIFRIKTFFRD